MRSPCTTDGCSKPVRTKGMCNACYEYKRKHGTVIRPSCRQPTPPDVRIWKHVNKHGPIPERRPELGPCWLWTSTTNKKGYGEFAWAPGKKIMAHRAVWRLLVGEISEKLQLDHLCFVHGCVRPSHLEPVTNAENMARQAEFRLRCRNKHDLRVEGTVMRGKKRMCARCDRERLARFYTKHGGRSGYESRAA